MQPYPVISRLLAPKGCSNEAALRAAVEGQTVLVTGSSFGIGEALAKRLGRAGAKVLLAARSADKLTELQSQIQQSGGQAHCYQLDLSIPEQVDQVAEQILNDHGRVDVVVHNAGRSIRRSLHRSLDRAHDFERLMAVNYLGPVRLQLALFPSMIEARQGHIINVSSIGIRIPPAAFWAAYTASKSAFDIWLGCASPELKADKICCTSVYLGLVHTRMSAPTEAYRSLPGQTADQAACVLCRAIIDRPRTIAPWWLGPVHWLSGPLERPMEWAQSQMLGRRAKG